MGGSTIDIKQYNKDNVFAKILRKELPSKTVYESEHSYAFTDINPVAPVHVLVICKGEYTCFCDFMDKASIEEKADFFDAVNQTAKKLGVEDGGYRVVSNVGASSGQEVPHFHMHIIAGKKLHAKC